MSDGHELPLSSAQSGIWFAHHLRPGSPAYNTGEYVDIPGPIDAELFETAVRRVVDETESLRVRLTDGAEGPRQVVTPSPDWSMHHVDLTSTPDPLRAAERWMRTDLSTPVGLTRDPLFRQALFTIAPDRFLWYQRVHHIVVDGFSMSLIARRVAKTYTRLVEGRGGAGPTFGPLSLLLAHDAAYHASEQPEQDRAFWADRLAAARIPSASPAARRPPRTASCAVPAPSTRPPWPRCGGPHDPPGRAGPPPSPQRSPRTSTASAANGTSCSACR